MESNHLNQQVLESTILYKMYTSSPKYTNISEKYPFYQPLRDGPAIRPHLTLL